VAGEGGGGNDGIGHMGGDLIGIWQKLYPVIPWKVPDHHRRGAEL
jgi:hypothetical protein